MSIQRPPKFNAGELNLYENPATSATSAVRCGTPVDA